MQSMLCRLARHFRPATAHEAAVSELSRARRALLEAQSSREYYDSLVGCLRTRIKRLEAYLGGADQ